MKEQSESKANHNEESPRIRRVNICGLWIHDITLLEAIDEIHRLVASGASHAVFTPNVDHIVLYHRDADLRCAYKRASLVLPDSFYVVLASRLLGRRLRERVMGSDLFPAFCERAASTGLRPFLLGAAPGVADRAAQVLAGRFPGLQFAGTCSPPAVSLEDVETNRSLARQIGNASPDVVFVAFGAPKQEIWIDRYLEMTGAPVGIGVGAAFDFAAGVQHEPPQWMQRLGLGWFDRLMHNPRRLFRRYLLRDPVFFWLLLQQRLLRREFSGSEEP
jgi:N-acetylglucosaminyldiphosphoundecaprenol N-acetyl-beta-D-mannosaminyltransferase